MSHGSPAPGAACSRKHDFVVKINMCMCMRVRACVVVSADVKHVGFVAHWAWRRAHARRRGSTMQRCKAVCHPFTVSRAIDGGLEQMGITSRDHARTRIQHATMQPSIVPFRLLCHLRVSAKCSVGVTRARIM